MSTPNPAGSSPTKRDRVFVSYSHLDGEWLDKLRELLHPDIRNDRIDYRDDRNIEPGDKWYEQLVDYIAHARVAVLLVSPNFLSPGFIMKDELPLIVEAEKHGLTILWVPLSGCFYGANALPGADRITCYQAVWNASQPLDSLAPESQTARLIDLCKRINRLINPPRTPNNLPFTPLGDLFKGREDDLARLDEQLRLKGSSAIVQPRAVSGPGGVGKTRLAVEYARRHEEEFTALLFVSANSPADLAANVARLSADDGALDLTEYKSASQDDQYAAVTRWLQQNKGWLLILDNVDTRNAVAAVQKLVAKLSSGHVIVTSRITTWGGGIPRIPLSVLSADASVSLLIDKANTLTRTPRPDDAQQARLLAEQLGYLPLALTHAAAYIGESDIGFDAYLTEFEAALQYHEEEVIEYNSDPEIEKILSDSEQAKILKTVATTYFISIDRLGPIEKALLRAASFLAPAPIPTAMFADCPDELVALVDLWCEETGEAPVEKSVRDAETELVRHSLVDRDGDVFTIHRMERLVLSHKVPKDRVSKWVEATRAVLVRYAPDKTAEDPTTWPVWDKLRPHAEALIALAGIETPVPPHVALLEAMSQLYFGKALYQRSLEVDELLLPVFQQLHGPKSDEVAHRFLCLGETLRVLDRYQEAEDAFRRSLAIREENDPEGLHVASDLNYLALALGDRGERREAEELHRRAMGIYESRINEADKGDFSKTLNNLANLVEAKGLMDEAESLKKRAVQMAEEGFGPDHPKTLICVTNLGSALEKKGDREGAEALYRRAANGSEKALGANHPTTLSMMTSYANSLGRGGKHHEAEPIYQRVFSTRKHIQGENHNDTLIAMNNLGWVLQAKGNPADAVKVFENALEIRDRIFGFDHPQTLTVVHNLARALEAVGDMSGAVTLCRRELNSRERTLGMEHPDTLTSVNNLALMLFKAGDYSAAEALYRRAANGSEKALGANHPTTLSMMTSYANSLGRGGKHHEAEPIYQRVFSTRKHIQGENHNDTLIAMNNLGWVLQAKGNPADAVKVFENALEIRDRIFGFDHPQTLTVVHNLARALEAVGDMSGAVTLCRRELNSRERTLGMEHPDTLTSVNNLALMLFKAGDYSAAEPLYRRVLETRERTLGAVHPDTLASVKSLAVFLDTQGDATSAEPLYARVIDAAETSAQSENAEFVINLNNYALVQRKSRLFTEAANLLRRAIGIEDRLLPPNHPKRAHRRNNLAIVYTLAHRFDDAGQTSAEAWSLKANQHDITSGRILLGRIALSWLRNTGAEHYLGQLRVLMSQPEIPCLGGIDSKWDANDILDHLRSKLLPHNADLATAIVAALNDPALMADLERHSLWQSAPLVSLDTPWPGEPEVG